ncbi:craniofacial development protein 2-like [Artemia franciscana]|uniref:craniofacial development protein 2-like n=1 Tax=Artemia franciscana TaxID=6661 RepID=UPI0032DAC9F7
MTRETSRSLLKWTPISPRILVARFTGRQAKLSVVVCYAPTNVAEVETKKEFYHSLQTVVNNIPKHDIMCILSDLNAIVGNYESYCPQAFGRHGLGVRNENGTMLINFAMANDLVIGGSLFPRRDVHKYSWTSPGRAVRNQIDHCLVSRKFRSSIQDGREYRGADVGSYHDLLVTKFFLKLKRNEKKAPNSEFQFDSDKLLDRTSRRELGTELSNKLEALYISDQDDQEMIWDQIKNLYNESPSKTVGHHKKPKDQWLSDRTWQLIEERKVAKL